MAGMRRPGLAGAAAGGGALAGSFLESVLTSDFEGEWSAEGLSLAGASAPAGERSARAGASLINTCNMRGAANSRRERSWVFMRVGGLGAGKRGGAFSGGSALAMAMPWAEIAFKSLPGKAKKFGGPEAAGSLVRLWNADIPKVGKCRCGRK